MAVLALWRTAKLMEIVRSVSALRSGAMLYLEDLKPGDIHRGSGEPAWMDADGIKTFARQFDPQPFHVDEKSAEKTFFRGLAASGWHAAAVTMRLLVEGGLSLAGGIIGASVDEVRWPRPVRPGDRLRV